MWTAIVGGAGAVGRWILRNPSILLAAVFCAAFVMIVISKSSEIATLRRAIEDPKIGYQARVDRLAAGLATSRNNVATLTDTLKRQNDSIDALKTQGDAAGARFDTIIAGMAAANATTVKRLDALRAARPGPDKCVSALDLVHGAVQ